ncbi:MAG: signal peptidase I [Gemmatimonadetes bacterium]|nr:MAG: signal peptidase I [Gemmatimonadota bacterium]
MNEEFQHTTDAIHLETAKKQRKPKSKFREYVEAILIAVIVATLIRTSVVEAYRIPSGSMEDTLLVGDFLFVNKFIYGARLPFIDKPILPAIRDPQPGDILVFKYPEDLKRNFIKRCIAVEGQTVEIRNKVVYVDGQPLEEPYTKFLYPHQTHGVPRDNFGPVTIPKGQLFMMGDNRDNSQDSRYWGLLDRDLVKGEAFMVYWSFNYDVPLWDIGHKIRWDRIGHLIQ